MTSVPTALCRSARQNVGLHQEPIRTALSDLFQRVLGCPIPGTGLYAHVHRNALLSPRTVSTPGWADRHSFTFRKISVGNSATRQ
jgi:hypothetical protein